VRKSQNDRFAIEEEIRKLFTKRGIYASRKNPTAIDIAVSRLRIEAGKVVRDTSQRYSVMPYTQPLTKETFAIEEAEILADVPVEFRTAVSYQAYEDGHSAGYDEVIIYVQRYVNMLKNPIAEYTRRIQLQIVE